MIIRRAETLMPAACLFALFCWLPCSAADEPQHKTDAASQTLNVPVPAPLLLRVHKAHIGSTRGYLHHILPKGWETHYVGGFQFIYLLPGPADFQKRYPKYRIGVLVTFGHDYPPAQLLNGTGSRKDKQVEAAYNAAVITAIAEPYVTLRTPANSGPNVIY